MTSLKPFVVELPRSIPSTRIFTAIGTILGMDMINILRAAGDAETAGSIKSPSS